MNDPTTSMGWPEAFAWGAVCMTVLGTFWALAWMSVREMQQKPKERRDD